MKRFAVPVALFALTAAASAEVKLPTFFADHMVLQRELPAPVWGHADPGEVVTVEFAGQQQSATAGADGRWLVRLAPMSASAAPQTLTVRGSSTITIQDVLTGEVWIASGQSNMGFNLSNAHNAASEIPKADDPQLRFFNVKTQTAAEPQTDVTGKWDSQFAGSRRRAFPPSRISSLANCARSSGARLASCNPRGAARRRSRG